MAKVYQTASTDKLTFSGEHRIKLSSFWEEKEEEIIKKIKNTNEVASSAGLLDQFPSAPCGGFHLQEN